MLLGMANPSKATANLKETQQLSRLQQTCGKGQMYDACISMLTAAHITRGTQEKAVSSSPLWLTSLQPLMQTLRLAKP